jgi:hypothetical protein
MSRTFNMVGGGAGGGIKLVAIDITKAPNKVNYRPGQTFDPAGMEVTATYSNGATLLATGWTYSPTGALAEGTQSVTIVYTEGGVSAQASQAITVQKASFAVPSQGSPLVYTGGQQSPDWTGYDSAEMTIGGTSAATDAGDYQAIFSLKDKVGTQWADGTTEDKTVSWSIGRATVNVPTQSGSLTYNGEAQSPSWSGYDSSKMTMGGTTSGTNAGSYDANFTTTANYQWPDGTTEAKTVSWSIQKAAGSLSISPESMTLDTSATSKVITVTRAGTGAISAQSSAPTIASVSVSGNQVTVTGLANGSANITISVAADTNYTAPASKQCSVTVSLLKDNFADNEWSEIIAACQSGNVPDSWVVGNYKNMTINGKAYRIDIIGKNHDTYAAGGTAPLTFQMHDCYTETKQMNSSNTNSGGWQNSAMRTTHLPAILNMMPAEVKAAIRDVQKKSSAGNQSSSIQTTNDKLFLLSEIEIFGSTTYSFAGEGKQYAYYQAGNSKVKNLSGSAYAWWERSPFSSNSTYFCIVSSNGDANANTASNSYGVAFGFCF